MKKILFAINLQIFAETYTQTTSLDGLSPEMKTFYDMTLLDEAGPELVHDQFGQKRDIPKGGGKKIEFRKFDSLPKALEPLTEGVTPQGNKLNVTAKEAEVKQYGDFIEQSDVLELTAVDNTIVEATKMLGKQAGQTLDTVVREVLQSGTNVMYCPDGENEVVSRTALTANSKLTVAAVKKAVTHLRRNNTPKIDGSYVAIIHPDVAHDLMNDPKWEDAHKYTNPENIYNGELGKIAGVRFVESTEAKIYVGAENDCPDGLAVYGCIFLGANAYGTTEITGGGLQTIIKQKGSGGTTDPLDQRSTIGWKALKTAEILIENYILRVECCSEFSSIPEKSN